MYVIKIDGIVIQAFHNYSEALRAFDLLPSNSGRIATIQKNGSTIRAKVL